MATSKELLRFTRDALSAGRSREDIAQALDAAGWSASEVSDALGAWSETPFSHPIPRPQTMVSARDFFIYALIFGLLITVSIALVQLFHTLIDVMYDDASRFAISGLRWNLAILIVMTPPYLWLEIRERRALAVDPALSRSAIRKWMIYLTLLIAAGVLLGDMVSVVHALLSGELTLQFILKALVVAAVAGFVFLYYLVDVQKEERA